MRCIVSGIRIVPFHASAYLQLAFVLCCLLAATIGEQIFSKIVKSTIKELKTALRHIHQVRSSINGTLTVASLFLGSGFAFLLMVALGINS